MDIYDMIDAALKEKHMSRRQLAISAGIPESSLAAAFARRSNMAPDNIEKIAKVLDISPAELMPQLQIFRELLEDRQFHLNINEEQINHLHFQQAMAIEFAEDDILGKLHKHENIDKLYTLLSSAWMLNEDGLNKAIAYLLDLNKIYDYRRQGLRIIGQKLITKVQEVTQCPEDAQQTDQACNPGSDQTGAGKVGSKPE